MRNPTALLALAVLLPGPAALAETHLFLRNRSTQLLCVEETTMTGGLAGRAWRQPAGGKPRPDLGCRYTLEPGDRIEFLRLNDDRGVKDGRSYWFRTTLREPGGSRLVLEHKLDGEAIGSNLWRRVGASPFVDDDRTRRHAWITAGGAHVVASGEDDGDFYYDVRPRVAGPAARPGAPEGEVRLLTWNLGRLPTRSSQAARHQLAPLAGYDVLVLTEVFTEEAKRIVRRGVAAEYPFATTSLGGDGWIDQDGGVLILSRWPIEYQDEVLFEDSSGTDAYARKGALYARIHAPGGILHVVGTHTQADPDLASVLLEGARPGGIFRLRTGRIRRAQLRQVRGFLDRLALPAGEPVLIAGDLNVPREDGAAHAAMLEILGAREIPGEVAEPTWDPENSEVDEDDAAQRLDYVLERVGHPRAYRGGVEVEEPRAGTTDLSDHYAVAARVAYRWGEVELAATPRPAKPARGLLDIAVHAGLFGLAR